MAFVARVLGVLVGTLVVVGLAIGAAYVTGAVEQPTAGVEDHGDWGDVSDERTEIVTSLWVHNPNQLGLSLGGNVEASYQLYLNHVNIAQGSKEGITIQPGNNTVDLTSELKNRKLPSWWVAFVQNDETIDLRVVPSTTIKVGPLSASPDLPTQNKTLLANRTPVSGALSQTASEAEGRYTENLSSSELQSRLDRDRLSDELIGETYEIGYVVERGWATWGEVDEETTVVDFHFLVSNPSEEFCVPAEPENVGVSVAMNDVDMFQAQGDDTELQNPGKLTDGTDDACTLGNAGAMLAPQETTEVVYSVEMGNDKVDDWFTSHVEAGERTDVRAELQFVFSAAGTTFRVPEESRAAYTCSFQTGILVDGQETATDCAQPASISGIETSDGPGSEDDETSTETRKTETDTGTHTETDTATTTATATTTETATETSSSEPTASVDASPRTGDAPLEVSFDASDSTDPGGEIERYVWRFNDGTGIQEGKTVTHTFRTAGEYDVELTVIDDDGNRDTVTITITVDSRTLSMQVIQAG